MSVLKTATTTTLEQRLAGLGFVTYDEYLASSYWEDARIRWKLAGMPEECLVCHRVDYSLHHRSYERIGEEPIGHLVALCEPHHYEVHRLPKTRRPEMTLWNAHLHYRKAHHARKAGKPKLVGQILADHAEAILAV
jgi:hypothetical protein